MPPFSTYLRDIERNLAAGDATEHTHRPALKALLEASGDELTATNEPRRMTDVGAPDMRVLRGAVPIGYIETKDVGISLDQAERSEQLRRYRGSLHNLILTDYLEFRWYVHGQPRATARLATIDAGGRLRRGPRGLQEVSRLLQGFFSEVVPSVGTPRELAQRMAALARITRDLITHVLQQEGEHGQLHGQLQAFREVLIPDLDAARFADMYAQTMAYGLFAARCAVPNAAGFTRQAAAYQLSRTNPFLRRLFAEIAGSGLDDRIAWAVDDLAQLLAQADMAAVLANFGTRTALQDPVLHFYEDFLREYDPQLRERRGVYYTPEPVVSYIVRSIDHLLKTRFGRPRGLADEQTLVLDPACGTGSFLYAVIDLVREAFQGQEGMWSGYVREHLLPRIFGFELLMAPYALAHMKLGLQLAESGYDFGTDERLGIYLTNTLEEAMKRSETLFAQWVAEEANAAAEIKRDKPVMVVLGNPPYSGESANASWREVTDGQSGRKRRELTWIGRLIEDYKRVDGQPLGEKNPKWLQDDYVKFLRFGQWRIERTGQGILGFITNHAYLDNPTFRGMRQSLMQTFDEIYILDMHGNVRKREVAPDGGPDENVFDIQQGVAIVLMVKLPKEREN